MTFLLDVPYGVQVADTILTDVTVKLGGVAEELLEPLAAAPPPVAGAIDPEISTLCPTCGVSCAALPLSRYITVLLADPDVPVAPAAPDALAAGGCTRTKSPSFAVDALPDAAPPDGAADARSMHPVTVRADGDDGVAG
jgi:hypothetical protein